MSPGLSFLILNTDYPEFLTWHYERYPGLEVQPYKEQMRVRVESLFGFADFYSGNLRKIGDEAHDIYANNEFMQMAWAREHGILVQEQTPSERGLKTALERARRIAAKTPLRYLKPIFRPALRSLEDLPTRAYEVLAAQIKHYKPDILLNQAMDGVSSGFLKEMKPYVRLLVGQHASPLPSGADFDCYDLVISSLPNLVEGFRRAGLHAELKRLAFEPRVLNSLNDEGKKIPVSFVGSLSRHHEARVRLLEYLCGRMKIHIWGQGVDSLPGDSFIRQHYQGKAWGIGMYQILRDSLITLNHHIDLAGDYANNMRLYEATGVGALVLTDWKANLHELFEPGREVVAFRNPEECTELIQYYLNHDSERESIARAGQSRTLHEHTYYQRVQELVEVVRKYL